MEYGVLKLLSCSFTYQSKKIRFLPVKKLQNLALESEITERTEFFSQGLRNRIFLDW